MAFLNLSLPALGYKDSNPQQPGKYFFYSHFKGLSLQKNTVSNNKPDQGGLNTIPLLSRLLSNNTNNFC